MRLYQLTKFGFLTKPLSCLADIACTINLVPFIVSKLQAARLQHKADDSLVDCLYVVHMILRTGSDDVKRSLFERDRHGLVDALMLLLSSWIRQPEAPSIPTRDRGSSWINHPTHGQLPNLIRLVRTVLSDVLKIVEKDAA